MRLYTVVFANVAVTAVQDLFYINPAANKPVEIHSVSLSNVGIAADAGDAQEAFDRLEIIRVPATVTVGSGGTAPTPTPLLPNDAAASFTARVNDTTPATTSGTLLTVDAGGWNERSWGLAWLPPDPGYKLRCANGQALVVRLNSAPPDSIALSGTIVVEELL